MWTIHFLLPSRGRPWCWRGNVRTRVRHWSRGQLDVLLCQDQRRSGERHSANRLPLPYDLPTKHYRWREKRNANRRGCRFGYLASVSTHFAEKVSCQSGSCHCGILARFSSHSETRLPVDFCRGAELKNTRQRRTEIAVRARCSDQVESGATGWNSSW